MSSTPPPKVSTPHSPARVRSAADAGSSSGVAVGRGSAGATPVSPLARRPPSPSRVAGAAAGVTPAASAARAPGSPARKPSLAGSAASPRSSTTAAGAAPASPLKKSLSSPPRRTSLPASPGSTGARTAAAATSPRLAATAAVSPRKPSISSATAAAASPTARKPVVGSPSSAAAAARKASVSSPGTTSTGSPRRSVSQQPGVSPTTAIRKSLVSPPPRAAGGGALSPAASPSRTSPAGSLALGSVSQHSKVAGLGVSPRSAVRAVAAAAAAPPAAASAAPTPMDDAVAPATEAAAAVAPASAAAASAVAAPPAPADTASLGTAEPAATSDLTPMPATAAPPPAAPAAGAAAATDFNFASPPPHLNFDAPSTGPVPLLPAPPATFDFGVAAADAAAPMAAGQLYAAGSGYGALQQDGSAYGAFPHDAAAAPYTPPPPPTGAAAAEAAAIPPPPQPAAASAAAPTAAGTAPVPSPTKPSWADDEDDAQLAAAATAAAAAAAAVLPLAGYDSAPARAPPIAAAPPAAAGAGAAPAGVSTVDLAEQQAARMAKLVLGVETREERNARLRVVQADASSHLYSAKTFEQLDVRPELLRGINAMGFEKPSSIQEMALPMIIHKPRENLIAQAQSGSGKTVAFCLGLLERVDTLIQHPQALVITPTRELAVQCMQQTLLPMATFLRPPLTVMLGLQGTNLERGQQVTEHVVIGTPGTVSNWLRRGQLNARSIRVFVLDEADQMLATGGFADDCKRIKKFISQPHQSLLFSATFPQEVVDFAKRIIAPPINEIRLASDEELVLNEITQLWIDLRRQPPSKRIELLQDLYSMLEMGQSIVFCRTRVGCDEVTRTLNGQGFKCSNLHGEIKGFERDECMDAFRAGRTKVLITTNVLARGVDVPAVTLVVNYDMPTQGGGRPDDPDYESYLHRIGRTGRFGRRGVAINFVQDQNAYQVLSAIERHFSPHKEMIHEAPLDVEDLLKRVGDVIGNR